MSFQIKISSGFVIIYSCYNIFFLYILQRQNQHINKYVYGMFSQLPSAYVMRSHYNVIISQLKMRSSCKDVVQEAVTHTVKLNLKVVEIAKKNDKG